MVCNKCGKENIENAVFCSDCGERLAGAENKTEIRGYTKYSVEVYKKFQWFHFFKNKAIIIPIALLETIFIALLVLICVFAPNDDMIALGVILVSFFPIIFGITALTVARAVKKASEQEVFYTFTPEAVFVSSKGSLANLQRQMFYTFRPFTPEAIFIDFMNSQKQLFYSSLHKIYETSDCFYIYIAVKQGLVLLKSGIEDNKVEELHNLLLSKMPAGKFVSKIKNK